ncbi:MAG: hypothetical protein ROZ09_09875 [Thiobacillus sp.]|jgi:predicted PhzF superfamily epimerase YddE/YHI9|uniref:hypothetical protein n=1 Tax=Thiobacillus sp. TaxID=924 RepID=UPI002894636D|nr:hypothetical protein [Thiobacillus sp.]MDT3707124.1 hypothetical protein [Thiobacillus sp.]
MKVWRYQVDAFATRAFEGTPVAVCPLERWLLQTIAAAGHPRKPVTGSAHCALAPYRAGRLGKHRLSARQVSRHGGRIMCEPKGDRIPLSGSAVTFMEAGMTLPRRHQPRVAPAGLRCYSFP